MRTLPALAVAGLALFAGCGVRTVVVPTPVPSGHDSAPSAPSAPAAPSGPAAPSASPTLGDPSDPAATAAEAYAIKVDTLIWEGKGPQACAMGTPAFQSGLAAELGQLFANSGERLPTTCAGIVTAYGVVVSHSKVSWTIAGASVVSSGDGTWVVRVSYRDPTNTPDTFTVQQQSDGSLLVTDHEDDNTTSGGSNA